MKKNIKEAIKEHLYANEFAADPNNPGFVDRFIEHTKAAEWGANWRINSVWHDAAEEPERETAIIVLFSEENHEMETVYYTYDSPDDCWEEIKENHNFSKWAYVEDLLPNMED